MTFLEAWRLREKLRPDAAAFEGGVGIPEGEGDGLRPWLYGIATNVMRNTRRAARRHSAALARLPDRPADHDTVLDFADDSSAAWRTPNGSPPPAPRSAGSADPNARCSPCASGRA